MYKLPFGMSSLCSTQPLQLIYSDVWGSTQIPLVDNFKYYIIFVDHFFKYIWLFPIKTKDQVECVFINFKKNCCNVFSTTYYFIFFLDNGGEFLKLKTFFQNNSITHFLTTQHTSEQNGYAERRNRHIRETCLAFLTQAQILSQFWTFGFETAAYLINRMPTSTLNNLSLYEKLFHTCPRYKIFIKFRCLCFP